MKKFLRLLLACGLLMSFGSPSFAKEQDALGPDAMTGIDPKAMELMQKMLAAYRQMDSLSFTVRRETFKDGKLAGPEVLRTFAYQKPRRVAVTSAWKSEEGPHEMNRVIDGEHVYTWGNFEGEISYLKSQLPSEEYGETALMQYFSLHYPIDTVILGLDPFSPPWGHVPDTLELGPEQFINDVAVIPIVASWQEPDGVSKTTYFIGTDDLLLRRRTDKTSANFSLTHTFSAIKENASIPESTFELSVPAGTEWLPADSGSGQWWDPRLKIGENLFPFEAHDLNGTLISPDLFKGKVLLLHFFMPYLRDIHLPHIKAAYEAYHEKGFEIISIALNTDQQLDRELLEQYVRDENIQWPVLFDGMGFKGDVPRLYGVKISTFPILVGRDGKIVAVYSEAMRLLLDQNIRKALAQPE